MSRPPISHKKLSETLSISECYRSGEHPQGYWIYDKTRGMNLAMGIPNKDDAFIEVIHYYQRMLAETECSLADLQDKVDSFVSQFIEGES